MKELKRGDVVKLFGTKVKLLITEDQSTTEKMKGMNTKHKYIDFQFDDIVKVTRDNKTIYQLNEE